jgi:bacterioferritin-associated ferredoxin
MYVCLCNGFTDRQVKSVLAETGVCSTARIYHAMGVKPICGKCIPTVKDILRSAQANVADLGAQVAAAG